MKAIKVVRNDGVFDVLLLQHKGVEDKYSFVNLTKGHICPCVFYSEQEAIADLERYKENGRIKSYEVK